MLVNEYFRVQSIISNTFDVAVQNVGVGISVPPNLRNKGNTILITNWINLYMIIIGFQCSY